MSIKEDANRQLILKKAADELINGLNAEFVKFVHEPAKTGIKNVIAFDCKLSSQSSQVPGALAYFAEGKIVTRGLVLRGGHRFRIFINVELGSRSGKPCLAFFRLFMLKIDSEEQFFNSEVYKAILKQLKIFVEKYDTFIEPSIYNEMSEHPMKRTLFEATFPRDQYSYHN